MFGCLEVAEGPLVKSARARGVEGGPPELRLWARTEARPIAPPHCTAHCAVAPAQHLPPGGGGAARASSIAAAMDLGGCLGFLSSGLRLATGN